MDGFSYYLHFLVENMIFMQDGQCIKNVSYHPCQVWLMMPLAYQFSCNYPSQISLLILQLFFLECEGVDLDFFDLQTKKEIQFPIILISNSLFTILANFLRNSSLVDPKMISSIYIFKFTEDHHISLYKHFCNLPKVVDRLGFS